MDIVRNVDPRLLNCNASENVDLSIIIPPEGPKQNPVQRLAWRLLAEAETRPALIRRSDNSSEAATGWSSGSFPAMALLSNPALDVRQYLENLVSIAVGSAREAEDVSFEMRRANRRAKRTIAVLASFGVLGLIAGVAELTASRSATVRLSEVQSEVSTLQNMAQDVAALQQRWNAELAALSGQKADLQAAQAALRHQIADLQHDASALQDEVARNIHNLEDARTESHQNLEASVVAIPPAKEAYTADPRARRETSRPEPQQEASSLQAQPARRTHDFVAPRSSPDKKNPEVARTQIGPLQPQRKAELTALRLPSAPPPDLVSPMAQPIPVLMSGPSASQQLLIAQQRLQAGRLDEARRLLTMVQTRMVFQPVEHDRRAVQGADSMAADVGNAIRWLDMGDNRQALQVLNQGGRYLACAIQHKPADHAQITRESASWRGGRGSITAAMATARNSTPTPINSENIGVLQFIPGDATDRICLVCAAASTPRLAVAREHSRGAAV